MNKIFIFLMLILIQLNLYSKEEILICDFRNRTPEMIIDESGEISGPLKDILEEAAKKINYKIYWRITPFSRSINDLKSGKVDIVPRTIMNEQRKEFINFLGPINYQKKEISFLIKKDSEISIKNYEDLKKYKIGSKIGTFYFDEFNNDIKLNKVESIDDFNMSKMFINGRFDVMIVLDKQAIEIELKKNNFDNYIYAEYIYEIEIGNYYGMSKKSKFADIFEILNEELKNMKEIGRIEEIYLKYNIK